MNVDVDFDRVSGLLRVCAERHIMPYFGRLQDHQKSFKQGDRKNEVTVADHESEAFLTAELGRLLPGSVVVGEEATEANPALPDLLDDDSNLVWVIDPVDGTSNFARGDQTFCVMVALVADGETVAGWIYDASRDRMAVAQKGGGAWLDGQKIVVRPGAQFGKLQGFVGYKYHHEFAGAGLKTLRCAGHEYLRIASGEAAFSIYGKMKAWDHLAGGLLVQEAGGLIQKWDGSDYMPGDTSGGIICAANKAIWQAVRDRIPQAALDRQKVARK